LRNWGRLWGGKLRCNLPRTPPRILTLLRVLVAAILTLSYGPGRAQSRGSKAPQAPVSQTRQAAQGPTAPVTIQAPPDILDSWRGLLITHISFEGIGQSRLDPLPSHLAAVEGEPLRPDDVRRSLRQLYATGLFDTIQVEGEREAAGVQLIFRGAPRTFIWTVGVDGARGATLNTQLERATQLTAGTRFTQAKLTQAIDEMRSILADNGFRDTHITPTVTPRPKDQLVDLSFHVASGPQARVGTVVVTGNPGMSVETFRRHAHLRSGARIDHDTVSRALAGVLEHYRSENRLEAEIKLEAQRYDPASRHSEFHFTVNQGPIVKVTVQGVAMTQERIRHVIPIYEEGTVDEDLLNEGNRRVRDFYQRLGYFDVKVGHQEHSTAGTVSSPSTAGAGPAEVEIVYNVNLGSRRRVERVEVAGNHYFDAATLRDLLNVHAADSLDPHGSYSQALLSADVGALESVYQNNGFAKVKVTPETSTPETSLADKTGLQSGSRPESETGLSAGSSAPLAVTYLIVEGQQSKVGAVKIEGDEQVDPAKLTPLLNTTAGQLLSPRNLASDRDELVTYYLSRGFERPEVDVSQQPDAADPGKMDVTFHINEGQQVFVRNVLFTGLHYTRPQTVAKAITIHAGDPLDQSALGDTQRNLYEFALFNEVNTAVENPDGGNERKTVLLQMIEARRWALTYGFGFEAQTGTPHYNCGLVILSGASCNAAGKTGVSPRGLLDITRNNLFGREQSASLQATYGLLEQKIDLLYQIPHFDVNRNFGLNVSGDYANSLDVSTYVASKLEGGVRWTEHFSAPRSLFSKANTFIYEFNFRRVKVEAASLQVAPKEIELLSTAVRVGGPALTWIRDTRDSVLDAHRGTYTSFQEFLSDKVFGAQAVFNRLDVSNSSYWSFDKGRLVLARNTRYGQERAFGTAGTELIPLPERLYAGGTTSLRGFSINAAGPRDPETGYPIGGAGALINSTELRLPPPTLPFFGDALSFVIFHDMGNIFANASDAWLSALRVRQPDRSACTNPAVLPAKLASNSTGLVGT
jgi:outer membrane protein insertion porin family